MTSARQILSFALDGLLAHLGSLSPRPGGPTSLDAPPSLGPRRTSHGAYLALFFPRAHRPSQSHWPNPHHDRLRTPGYAHLRTASVYTVPMTDAFWPRCHSLLQLMWSKNAISFAAASI